MAVPDPDLRGTAELGPSAGLQPIPGGRELIHRGWSLCTRQDRSSEDTAMSFGDAHDRPQGWTVTADPAARLGPSPRDQRRAHALIGIAPVPGADPARRCGVEG